MKDEELRRLIRLVEESQIDELEIRRLFTRVRITKAGALRRGAASQKPREPDSAQVVHVGPVSEVPEAPGAEPAGDEGLIPIVSPIVGTYYEAPSPEAPPYVEVGLRVEQGQIVCIIEAMKLMNEIESEVSGTVERILVENAQPVEFNQALFLIRPEATGSQRRREVS